ncbi:hypothetical protein [Candidatus Villigracilis affinis]|uniref:hypothetical protein n=1 Tax=Candidatus Villigracilis affinis TaxID=3140682 RepID=UPI002A222574|nr:hypothetical protein [Anaerolineales bacterium]
MSSGNDLACELVQRISIFYFGGIEIPPAGGWTQTAFHWPSGMLHAPPFASTS